MNISGTPESGYAMTLPCEREVFFKNKKTMDMFMRLHKKKCDWCRHLIITTTTMQLPNVRQLNRNEVERQHAIINEIQSATMDLQGQARV